eukprot:140314_1
MSALAIFLLQHALIYILQWIACDSSYDATVGSDTMGLGNVGMAVAYNTANNEIVLLGGSPYSRQFTTFKSNQFSATDSLYFASSEIAFTLSQYYSTMNNVVWMITSNGLGFTTFDLDTYAIDKPAITIPNTNAAELQAGCLATIPDYLIVMGGEGVTDNVQIYDITQGTWFSTVPTLNKGRKSFACITVGTNVFAIGGHDGSKYLDTIESLDVSNIASTNLPDWAYLSGTLTGGHAGATAVSYGTDIIVVGGQASYINTDSVHLIDTTDGSCELVGSLAFVSSSVAAIVVGNTLYMFGGEVGDIEGSNQYQYITLAPLPATTTSVDPTSAPSRYPTKYPTSAPSRYATKYPTKYPTSAPSRYATKYPTKYPTSAPSRYPTTYPTSTPTVYPTTTHPTLPPTVYPTYNPLRGTEYPTLLPSNDPSEHTLSTLFPSASPVNDPTVFSRGEREVVYTYTTTAKQDVAQKEGPNLLMFVLWVAGSLLVCCALLVFVLIVYVSRLRRKEQTVNVVANLTDVHAAAAIDEGDKHSQKEAVQLEHDHEEDDTAENTEESMDSLYIKKEESNEDLYTTKGTDQPTATANSDAHPTWSLQLWLENVVKFPEYYDTFAEHGFVSLSHLKAISNMDTLMNIGIQQSDHQTTILKAIMELKEEQKQMTEEGLPRTEEGDNPRNITTRGYKMANKQTIVGYQKKTEGN